MQVFGRFLCVVDGMHEKQRAGVGGSIENRGTNTNKVFSFVERGGPSYLFSLGHLLLKQNNFLVKLSFSH